MANRLANYFVESWHELAKITWPTRNRAINVCILVVGFVLLSAVVLAGIDYVFHLGYGRLIDLAQS